MKTVGIAHLSDLHFGRDDQTLVAALARQVRTLRPDLVAISGDLTQRARRRELAAAAEFVAQLPAPVLVVPGNHDIPGVTPRRFLAPWRPWQQHFPEGLEPGIELDGLLALGANSVRSWGPYLDWSRGRLRSTQIQRIAARVSEAPSGKLRVLVAHHPMLLTPAAEHRGTLQGAASALRRLAGAGLDLVLGGHVHLGYAGIAEGIVVAHAGTGVSKRLTGEANGFNWIHGDRRAITIEHWRWLKNRFTIDGKQHFHRDADGWKAFTGERAGIAQAPSADRPSAGPRDVQPVPQDR
jgi:3',5'-cyclic AMP phosphodiesterase CpdA